MINRITWHWTVSRYKANTSSLNAYHFIIEGDGTVVPGKFPPSANFSGVSLIKGRYAAHTRGLNSGNIGISVASMLGAKEVPFTTGLFPMKEEQIESLLELTKKLSTEYGVIIGPRHTLSHAEVQPTLGVKQNGKWDYMWLPGLDGAKNSVEIGNILRGRLSNISAQGTLPLFSQVRPTIRRGSRGSDVFALQTRLGITADSVFGPKTENAVIKFQKSRQLLPDGIVGPMTWASLGV